MIILTIFSPLCCIYTMVWMMYKWDDCSSFFISFFFSVSVFSPYKTYPITLYFCKTKHFVKLVCRIQGSPTLAENLSIIMFMWCKKNPNFLQLWSEKYVPWQFYLCFEEVWMFYLVIHLSKRMIWFLWNMDISRNEWCDWRYRPE